MEKLTQESKVTRRVILKQGRVQRTSRLFLSSRARRRPNRKASPGVFKEK